MSDTPVPPSPAFLAAFRRVAGAAGHLGFRDFMQLALYDPEVGYYRADRRRVGRDAGTDFYTASTSGAVFGELVAAAAATLLGGRDPREFTFVEIGAEAPAPGRPAPGILEGVSHGFGAARAIPLGHAITLSGPSVVFANELFDAQPFERFVFRRGGWHRLGVAERDGRLAEVELAGPVATDFLPARAPEGYQVDAPLAATALLETIAVQPWTGLFLTCDYGRTLAELLTEYPAGTARAYHRHRQSNDLLAQPGEQDLTCHLCWDWLADALRRHGFTDPRVETQEAFFVRHAGAFLAQASATEASRLSQRKLALLQLIHPAHLGQKFQVLHALRPG
jgi:SAM-dependent MidA family methyltransferase